jgi:hypothetical protein
MRFRLGLGLLLVVVIATASVDAQFGGLIKKKVGEAVGGDKGKADTPTPTTPPLSPNPPKSGLDCEVSPDIMDRVLRGLEAERAEREAALQELGEAKKPDDYAACRNDAMLSPEAQRLLEALGTLPDDASPEETRRLMTKAASDTAAFMQERCGIEQGEARATFNQRSRNAQQLGPQTANMTECYGKILEHSERFCMLPPADQDAAENEGLRVPGTGQNVYWVFTAGEAQTYTPNSKRLGSLMTALEQQDQQEAALLK